MKNRFNFYIVRSVAAVALLLPATVLAGAARGGVPAADNGQGGADGLPKRVMLVNEHFEVELDAGQGTIASLRQTGDGYGTEFVNPTARRALGQLTIRYTDGSAAVGADVVTVRTDDGDAVMTGHDAGIGMLWERLGASALGVEQRWELRGDELVWWFSVSNKDRNAIRICDIQIPMDFNTHFEKKTDNYTRKVIRHHFCSWDGSFAYWCRPNGQGGRLVMVPGKGTPLEYYDGADGFSMYIHSAFAGRQVDGAWCYPFTSTVLAAGEKRTYSLHFRWADDDQGIRDAIYEMGGMDVVSVPGMTVACGMDVLLALRTRDGRPELLRGDGFEAEWLRRQGDYEIYRLRFARRGEHAIEVGFGDNRRMRLDYFVTDRIDELLKARAQHLVEFQQYRGDAWYDGLFTQWNMDLQRFTTPDDAQGLYPYIVAGSDDPSLGKAPLIAQKNVFMPVEKEIEAVEYYIEHFVWGRLQRTDQELPRPYAIYGCDSWYALRNSGTGFNNGGHGEDRMWRTFDYTHIIQLYYYMYEVARLYPGMVRYLDADGYLLRAYNTAKAFFEIPITIFMKGWAFHGYCSWAFKQGNFGEMVIVPLIDALDASGYTAEATKLRGYWETKVKYMVYDEPYPFGSEMIFDTTAFESTHAIAKYGMEHDVTPDGEKGFYDPNAEGPGKGGYLQANTDIKKEDFLEFMKREQRANKAARCIMEPAYYLMGSDIRGSNLSYLLSYMTQMGAEGIFDTALYYSDHPEEDFRIAYASYMAGWMQIHSGADYPWYASEKNRGAAAWGYQPIRGIEAWCGRGFIDGYGIWKVDGEIDCGFAGGLRMASSVLVNDPIFGLFYYGGHMEKTDDGIQLQPMDGIQQRLYLRHTDSHVDVILERDYIRKASIRNNELIIEIACRTGNEHENTIHLTTKAGQQNITYTAPAGEETSTLHIQLPE